MRVNGCLRFLSAALRTPFRFCFSGLSMTAVYGQTTTLSFCEFRSLLLYRGCTFSQTSCDFTLQEVTQ